MIAFFDTSVHIALLRGEIALDTVLRAIRSAPVRLSPARSVLMHRVKRGLSGRIGRAVPATCAMPGSPHGPDVLTAEPGADMGPFMFTPSESSERDFIYL